MCEWNDILIQNNLNLDIPEIDKNLKYSIHKFDSFSLFQKFTINHEKEINKKTIRKSHLWARISFDKVVLNINNWNGAEFVI